MNSPVCKTNTLEQNEMIKNLKVHTCRTCEGNWMRYDDYWKWHTQPKDFMYEGSLESNECSCQEENYLPILDSKQAKLCPDCIRILIKYKVHKDLDFHVDHCGSCNGVWFDKNEWQAIRRNNLHDKMHNFFTSPWQKKLRQEATRHHLDKRYAERFGPEDYARLKEFKAWMENNANKSFILAYLQDEDPYKI